MVVAVLFGAIAVCLGGIPTTAVFRQVDHRDEAGRGDESESVEAASEILRGGAWIGVLERAAVFAAVVAGWPEGIAIVLAVKSLARYPELQAGAAAAAAERFIIGTFVSTPLPSAARAPRSGPVRRCWPEARGTRLRPR